MVVVVACAFELLFFFLQTAASFKSFFFVGLCSANVVDGALNGGITAVENAFGLVFGLAQNFATLFAQCCSIFFTLLDDLFEFLLFLANGRALVFPITFVASDVEQIFVKVDIIAAHDFLGIGNNVCRQACFARYFDGKRTARIAY